jgi:hypothetical protein
MFFRYCCFIGTLTALLLSSVQFAPSTAVASCRLTYACDSDICSAAREEYRRCATSKACSAARRLSALTDRLQNKKNDLMDAERRLARCLANPRTNRFGCFFLTRRVFGLRLAIQRLQARINVEVQRISADCDRSFPVPGKLPAPTKCQQNEARKYCPIVSAAQALAAVKKRCEDLRLEEGNATLNCGRPCLPPGLALVYDGTPVMAALESELPECTVPGQPTAAPTSTPTPIPTATPTPIPVATLTATPSATATPQVTPASTVTPLATATVQV